MAGQAQVSTLDDVLQRVRDVFQIMGDGTPIMIGTQYEREPGPGAPPRVVFIPDEQGKLGAVEKVSAGYIAQWLHGCRVRVLAAESGDDGSRAEAAKRLAFRVIAVLKALDPGHIVLAPGNPKDTSALAVDGPGVDITFTFTYVAHIPQEPAVLNAVKQLASVSPPDPDRPQGSTGKQIVVSMSADADR